MTSHVVDRASAPEQPAPGWAPLVASALVTCLVALFNRFPLAYSDTGNYLDNAIDLMHFRRPWFFFRPATYGALLIPFATPYTIWLVPFAQGLLVAACVSLALRTAGIGLSSRALVALFAGLSVLTSLPWFSGQIMPDVFTALMILLAFVCLWMPASSRPRSRWIVSALLALSIATHLSHFPIYVALLVAGVALRLAEERRPRPGVRVLARGAAPLLAALGLVIGPNWVVYGRPVLSRSSPIFALGHLVGEGAAQRYLERACPTRGYALCAERADLRPDVDWFLWAADGPRARSERAMARGDSTLLREAPLIVAGTLRQEWPAVLAGSLRASAVQVVTFGLHRGELTYSRSVASSMRRVGVGIEAAYARSRQAHQALPVRAATILQYVVVGAGLVALLFAWPALLGPAHGPFRALVAVVLVGVVVNAAILASLSTVHPRYQSRVIWLVPLLGAVALARRFEARRTPR